jgi:hypothetical protein
MTIWVWIYIALMFVGFFGAAFCWFRINHRDREDYDTDKPHQWQDHYLPTKDRHDG